MFFFIKVALIIMSFHSNETLMKTPNFKKCGSSKPNVICTAHVTSLLDSDPGEQPAAPVLERKLPQDFALP